MRKADSILIGLLAVIAVGLLGVAITKVHNDRQIVNANAPKPVVLQASTSVVIGSHPHLFGTAQAPYTLVEFGDYECPPCRAISQSLPTYLERYRGQVRFEFRNNPLSIHPQAFPAAEAAEAAGEQGLFWQMHDSLYKSNLDPQAIEQQARAIGANMAEFQYSEHTTARSIVLTDEHAAAELKVPGTPTFILCRPNGTVIRLGTLDQISRYVTGSQVSWKLW